jgi:hypothetical protein
VYLHLRFHGYGEGRWTDSAVRRYVADDLSRLEDPMVLDAVSRTVVAHRLGDFEALCRALVVVS